ncbi:MAG: hypothetical protein JOZ75_00575 [Candidatus Dormibacteraeota bacterium]|nr:hypothetical protein [Candidatus Dormibacteraeota bacterium]
MSCATYGLAGVPIRVEVDIASGLPNVTIVGLTDRAIQEARERVRSAIRNAGYSFPAQRITVNLAPAEVPKEGTGFDLAIAVAIFAADGHSPRSDGIAPHITASRARSSWAAAPGSHYPARSHSRRREP